MMRLKESYLHCCDPSRALSPVTQILASSAEAAIRSRDEKSSPCMIENVQSGELHASAEIIPMGVTPATSDVCTQRTSWMLEIATKACK